jgi:small conductance mechanosensitive channel
MSPNLTPHQLDAYTAILWTWAVTFIPHFVTAILILLVGYMFASWMGGGVRKLLDRAGHLDVAVRPVISAVVRYSILILILIAALAQIGVQTASLLAVLGAAGLAIGLALQGTLTNIAAGIMLLWLRPFQLGDFIEVPGNNVSGSVREIGLFVCILESLDGISVVAPNSAIWNSTLRNHTRNSGRLISLSITFKREANVDRAREVLSRTLSDDERISRTQPPLVFVDNYGTGGFVVVCSFRAAQGNLGELQRIVLPKIERDLEALGDPAFVPTQIVRTLPVDTDPARLLAETTGPTV